MGTRGKGNWTRQEHILAFRLYTKIPFGTIHMRNPRIIELAQVLGRPVGSVSLKLANFARLDPEQQARGIRGMPHGAKGEEEVWREFYANPEVFAYESERLWADLSGRPLETIAQLNDRELPKEGLEREYLVRVRVNQRFFRDAILSAYNNRCCVTGLDVPELLVASHIVPWAADPRHRMNPHNGLCLNALHDRAFDRRLMFIADDLTVRFRQRLLAKEKKGPGLDWLLSYEGRTIALPDRFKPDPTLLAQHSATSETSWN